MRVCEQGVVVRQTFVPWSACRRWYWDACYRDVIVMEFNHNPKVALKVKEEEREAVEAFLESKVSAAIFRALAYRG